MKPKRTFTPSSNNSVISDHVKTIYSCQEKINSSGNIQVVAKNIRILLNTLKALSEYSSENLENAGFRFSDGTPAEWYTKINNCKHQIIAQVPNRVNYKRSQQFRALPEELDSIQYKFSDCLSNVDNISGARNKLNLCEKALPLLPDIVLANLEQDGNLFETPYICGLMVEMYLRLGEWQKAKESVAYFNSCNAYFSDPIEYTDTLAYIDAYQLAAQTALLFLNQNPGFLQKKMYQALGDKVDHDCLQHFLRCSEQIRKVKNGSTNELYVAK